MAFRCPAMPPLWECRCVSVKSKSARNYTSASRRGTYQGSKRRGHQAVLTTRDAPDIFTLRVATIRPDEEGIIGTSYIHLAQAEAGG
jgi:hypothetical protein